MTEELVSCIGIAVSYPLIQLCDQLNKSDFRGVNRLQSSTSEHGTSCSIIILAVSMLESACNRANYILGLGYQDPIKLIRIQIGNDDIADDLREIYVLRDAITHNHMWKVEVPDSTNLNDPNISFTLIPGYGDKKFNHVTDMSTQQTRRLNLNVVPQKISRKDVAEVLDIVYKVITLLNNKDNRIFPVEDNYYLLGDKSYKFRELIDLIVNKWRTLT